MVERRGGSAGAAFIIQPRGWLYSFGVERSAATHPADGNLFLLEQAGLRIGQIRNRFFLPADELEAARRFFAANHLDFDRPTLFLQPFTSSALKNWPLGKFSGAGARTGVRADWQIVFGGGPSDRVRLAPAGAAGFAVAAGVPLLVSAGLTQLSTLVVGATPVCCTSPWRWAGAW